MQPKPNLPGSASPEDEGKAEVADSRVQGMLYFVQAPATPDTTHERRRLGAREGLRQRRRAVQDQGDVPQEIVENINLIHRQQQQLVLQQQMLIQQHLLQHLQDRNPVPAWANTPFAPNSPLSQRVFLPEPSTPLQEYLPMRNPQRNRSPFSAVPHAESSPPAAPQQELGIENPPGSENPSVDPPRQRRGRGRPPGQGSSRAARPAPPPESPPLPHASLVPTSPFELDSDLLRLYRSHIQPAAMHDLMLTAHHAATRRTTEASTFFSALGDSELQQVMYYTLQGCRPGRLRGEQAHRHYIEGLRISWLRFGGFSLEDVAQLRIYGSPVTVVGPLIRLQFLKELFPDLEFLRYELGVPRLVYVLTEHYRRMPYLSSDMLFLEGKKPGKSFGFSFWFWYERLRLRLDEAGDAQAQVFHVYRRCYDTAEQSSRFTRQKELALKLKALQGSIARLDEAMLTEVPPIDRQFAAAPWSAWLHFLIVLRHEYARAREKWVVQANARIAALDDLLEPLASHIPPTEPLQCPVIPPAKFPTPTAMCKFGQERQPRMNKWEDTPEIFSLRKGSLEAQLLEATAVDNYEASSSSSSNKETYEWQYSEPLTAAEVRVDTIRKEVGLPSLFKLKASAENNFVWLSDGSSTVSQRRSSKARGLLRMPEFVSKQAADNRRIARALRRRERREAARFARQRRQSPVPQRTPTATRRRRKRHEPESGYSSRDDELQMSDFHPLSLPDSKKEGSESEEEWRPYQRHPDSLNAKKTNQH